MVDKSENLKEVETSKKVLSQIIEMYSENVLLYINCTDIPVPNWKLVDMKRFLMDKEWKVIEEWPYLDSPHKWKITELKNRWIDVDLLWGVKFVFDVEWQEKSFLYCSDTNWNKNIPEWIRTLAMILSDLSKFYNEVEKKTYSSIVTENLSKIFEVEWKYFRQKNNYGDLQTKTDLANNLI